MSFVEFFKNAFTAWDPAYPTAVPIPPAWAAEYLVWPIFKLYLKQKLAGAGEGYTITSGFRTADHNADVGGVADSAHVYGLAADLTGSQSLYDYITSNWQGFSDQESDHMHVNLPRPLAWTVIKYWILGGGALVLLGGYLAWPKMKRLAA